jgi:hypothetical protein
MDMLLNNALDCGITELDFWEMTPGEVTRAIESKNRIVKIEAQEKATYDYIQATLIIKGVSICLGDKSSFPTLQEAYPGVFAEVVKESEEKIQEQKMQLSALRFRQFAQSYNDKFKNKEVPK